MDHIHSRHGSVGPHEVRSDPRDEAVAVRLFEGGVEENRVGAGRDQDRPEPVRRPLDAGREVFGSRRGSRQQQDRGQRKACG
jgi:hypothetical protein